ncbi:(2Fe-2S) ferredoxin domain-containing protein [bacterium]|jgi:(2Fe-2S) ferredoxin|nr:(2Fe-2S) ferredoxin domain-containing protein [bacterium]
MSDKIKIYVCTKGKKCPKKGSDDVCTAFESVVSELGCSDTVLIKGSKCLDLCKKGPAVVTMPDKISYGRVTAADAKEIVANLVAGGKPIERLRLKKKE